VARPGLGSPRADASGCVITREISRGLSMHERHEQVPAATAVEVDLEGVPRASPAVERFEGACRTAGATQALLRVASRDPGPGEHRHRPRKPECESSRRPSPARRTSRGVRRTFEVDRRIHTHVGERSRGRADVPAARRAIAGPPRAPVGAPIRLLAERTRRLRRLHGCLWCGMLTGRPSHYESYRPHPGAPLSLDEAFSPSMKPIVNSHRLPTLHRSPLRLHSPRCGDPIPVAGS
jgi:hypothetical protein